MVAILSLQKNYVKNITFCTIWNKFSLHYGKNLKYSPYIFLKNFIQSSYYWSLSLEDFEDQWKINNF